MLGAGLFDLIQHQDPASNNLLKINNSVKTPGVFNS